MANENDSKIRKNNKITLVKSEFTKKDEKVINKNKIRLLYGIIFFQLTLLVLFAINYYFKIFYEGMKISTLVLASGLILYTMNYVFNMIEKEKGNKEK